MTSEKILCAAIHYRDGEEYPHQPKNINSGYVICGHRHHNIFIIANLTGVITLGFDHEQGFLTSANRFVDRYEALKIAELNFQIIDKHKSVDELMSEDLY